ncbi:MAG: FKBP-type peptidyl-prolyl cis-trans isomerase [Oceanospirillaceae bacterium]
MQINQECTVSFHYSLLNEKGEVVDTSKDQEPVSFETGKGKIIPGLEKGMQGKSIGDKFQLKIKADDGYGQWDEEKVYDIDAGIFSGMDDLEVGLMCEVTNPQGEKELVTVVEISDELITVDANHPYVGNDLKFSIEIVNVTKNN